MTRPICEAERKPGERCAGWALPGGSFCWAHEPARAAERAAARSKGGKIRAIEGRRRKLTTPAAVVDFLSGLIHDLSEGRKDPDLVRVVAYALSVQCKALELAEQSETRELHAEARRLLEAARRA